MTVISGFLLVAVTGQGTLDAIVIPAVVLGSLGLLLGLGLAFAGKKLAVEKDPLVVKIEALLPGANCGGCAYPGCTAFAEAVAAGKAPADGCVAANASINAAIAEAVGSEISDSVRKIAVVLCNGGYSAEDAFNYHGPQTCVAADMIMGGQKGCSYGCLSFGDCREVCPFNAIIMSEDGLPVINTKLCTGCGKCVDICPKDIILLWPDNRQIIIACSNRDKGGIARKVCSVACIGCGKCKNVCPFDAIRVENFLAEIDPEKCQNCGLCARVCPTDAILDFAPARPRAYIGSDCIGCTLCAKACPINAITGELKERHEVNQELCAGCGQCIAKCPKDCIRMVGALGYQRDTV